MPRRAKLSPQIVRSMIIPSILIAIVITLVLQKLIQYGGLAAFVISTFIFILILGYKEIKSIKNWIVQGILIALIGGGILAFIHQDQYTLIVSIEIAGIIVSAIIQYSIYKNLRKKKK